MKERGRGCWKEKKERWRRIKSRVRQKRNNNNICRGALRSGMLIKNAYFLTKRICVLACTNCRVVKEAECTLHRALQS